MGIPGDRVDIYRGLLNVPGADLRLVTMALAASLIADDRAPEAGEGV